MKVPGTWTKVALVLICLLTASRLWAQGPPYQTDDPVPVDLHHYEFYIFGGVDGTPAEMDSVGPAFEFNWGALPRVQLHAILPWGVVKQQGLPARRHRAHGIRADRYGARREGRVHQGDETLSADRHVPHVRDAYGQL